MKSTVIWNLIFTLAALTILGTGCDSTEPQEPGVDTTNNSRDIESADIYIYVPEDDGLPDYPQERFAAESSNDEQLRALERANYYRWYVGLPAMDMIEGINLAAQSHCDYWVLHKDKYDSSGLSVHNENPVWAEGFSGEAPWDRTATFGYSSGYSEVIAFMRDPEGSVDGWIDTLYHRIPFMDASAVACGYGLAGSGFMGSIDTMDFGLTDAEGMSYQGPDVVGIFPPPGATGIRVSFDGLESPEPINPPTGWPSGTIITLTWAKSGAFIAQEHEIIDTSTGESLEHVFADQTNDTHLEGANTIALYSYDPLKKGTVYKVHLKGMKAGAVWEKDWTFTTQRY
jgi:uncharacterized protein YkwD